MACPKDCEAITRQGVELVEKGDFKEAMNCFDKALTIDPNCFHTLTHKGNLLFKLGDNKAAKIQIDKALQLKPDFQDALEIKKLLV